mgnify:FL=1
MAKWGNAVLIFAGGVAVMSFVGTEFGSIMGPEPVAPDWEAISAWPGQEAENVEAAPDPTRVFTAIVLDDSGSMSEDMQAARLAVAAAVETMAPEDFVSIVALNKGLVLPFMPVEEARPQLRAILADVVSQGSTPLTGAVSTARRVLGEEAARAGGFGTYRILVTTDGQADDNATLRLAIEDLARTTPIQIATIGVGISGSHVLNRSDLGTFVAIDDVSDLEQALQSAVAEQTTFSAITSFGGE